MKKRLITFGLLILVVALFDAKGQQVFQFSQYLQNAYLINSATGGLHDYTELNMSYRAQWVGIQNAPQTVYASVTHPLGESSSVDPKQSSVRISSPSTYQNKRKTSYHALGGFVARDSYGPYAMNVLNFSYAFHLPIADKLSLSFSPNAGVYQVAFNSDKAQVDIANDPTYASYAGATGNHTRADLNLAFWLSHDKYFAGYSTSQLLGDRLNLSDQIAFTDLLVNHILTAGYHFQINNKLKLTPSLLARYINGLPFQVDLNVMADYRDFFWGGISYRSSQAIIGMAGVKLNNTFRLGYSFDLSFTALQLQNAGSHELVLGINLFNKEKPTF